ncbi:hypothetical protein AXZ77_0804 [Thioclava sp. ES.031]|uniref:hypothetical protein n=1 Tax=Thioclava sp. ES.031 TaxID=1798203 RepID=UPI000C01D8BD|nr:hypothetical protein [Thioclava sp. ES.031]PFG62227.1 hypothetical protein AXZ77_0804 [Thioclava sp. ES.031]
MKSAIKKPVGGAPASEGRFRRALAALGMEGEDSTRTSSVSYASFKWIQILFGIVLIYDAWTSLSWQHKVASAQALGLPTSSPVLHLLVIVLAFVELAVALSIMSNRGVVPMSWVGICYAGFVWIVFQHGGDFGQDGTDPGVALPYVVVFAFLIGVQRLRTDPDVSKNEMLTLARNGFGLLWGYDALLKFQPYFLNHFTDFLTSAQADMKGTLAASYDQLFLGVTNAMGPHLVAVLVALTEALVAASLISGRGLRIMAPVGFLLSFAIWSTAETWGGPYSMGVSAEAAQLFGAATIYMIAFFYIMTLYNPLDLLRTRSRVLG